MNERGPGHATRLPPTKKEPDEDLPFVHFDGIEVPDEGNRWLIEGVWPAGGVGILGGGPKLGKSILTTEMAVAVASGQPFLGVYEVADPGPVLVCSLEGQRWLASDRVRKVARFRGVADDASLPIEILDRSGLKLDTPADLRRLAGAIRRREPKLVILDPLVRIHDSDENAAVGGISKVLDALTWLQRTCGVCILVVHHNRKHIRKDDRPGLGLRGSSDIHAWGDANLYLRERRKTELTLLVEHRTAANPDPIRLRLVGDATELHFDVLDDEAAPGQERATVETIADQVIAVLEVESSGLGFGPLREAIGMRAPDVMAAIKALAASGRLDLVKRRWCLRSVPPSAPLAGGERNGDGGPG